MSDHHVGLVLDGSRIVEVLPTAEPENVHVGLILDGSKVAEVTPQDSLREQTFRSSHRA